MQKNDKFIVKIEDMGIEGEGIAKIDGQVVFVPFALTNEEVEIQIIYLKSKFAIGKILNILKPSPLRVVAPCPYFTKCGGCDIQHINYENQLILKHTNLVNTLKKIGGIDFSVEPVFPCQNPFNYRNKIALPVVFQNGRTVVGLYRKNSHKIVEINDCIIQEPFVKKLIEITNKYIVEQNIVGYDEVSNLGTLRHVLARYYNNQIIVTLVSTTKDLPKINEFEKLLKQNFKNFGLELNINNKKTNVILGGKTIHISGLKELEIEENGIKYGVSNNSFMQVNNYIRNAIYNFVLKNISNSEIIVDLYSGAGVLTSMLSKVAKKVYGIEIEKSAVKNANELMEQNGITNVTNICGDAECELEKLSGTLKEDFSLVLDPPRKGISEKTCNLILKTKPKRIIYISCNPATLSRDLKLLTQKYDILSITPFDMFPQTKHLETVVCLNSKN